MAAKASGQPAGGGAPPPSSGRTAAPQPPAVRGGAARRDTVQLRPTPTLAATAVWLLHFVEAACVLLCALALTTLLVGARVSAQQRQQQQEQLQSRPRPQRTLRSLGSAGPTQWRQQADVGRPHLAQDSPASPAVLAAMCAAGLALLAGWLLRRLQHLRPSDGGKAQAISLEGATRLTRLEALLERQLLDFAEASKQVEKLQLRTRLYASELRKPLEKEQQSTVQHAELLARMAKELEVLRRRADDTQQLLFALQSTSARQFQVTVDAIKQLRAAQ